MSIIINIAVPLSLEIVAAIKNGADVNNPRTANEVHKASFPVISEAIKTLPFDVVPKTESAGANMMDYDDTTLLGQPPSDAHSWRREGMKSVHCATPSSTFDGYTTLGLRTYWCLYASSSKSNSYYIHSKPAVDHVKNSNSDVLITEEIGWYEDVFVATIKTAILKDKGMQSLREKVSLEFRGRTLEDDRDLCSYGYHEGGILKLDLRLHDCQDSGAQSRFDGEHKRDVLQVKYIDTYSGQTGKEAYILLPRNPFKMSVSEVKSIIAKKDGYHNSVPDLFASRPDTGTWGRLFAMKDHSVLGDHSGFDGECIWASLPDPVSSADVQEKVQPHYEEW